MAAAVSTTEANEPFEVIAMDCIGPLSRDSNSYRYIHVFIDCFSRFVEIVPAESTSAKEAAAALLSITGRHGVP